MRARYSGPWEIERKLSDVNYILKTPGRRKNNQLCHINMLKEYHERGDEEKVNSIGIVNATEEALDEIPEIIFEKCDGKMENSSVLENLNFKLQHIVRKKRGVDGSDQQF